MEIKPNAIYDRSQVMELLMISTNKLKDIVNSGDLEAKMISNKWIFIGQSILDYVKSLPPVAEKKQNS